ncbi:hypothetical protein D3C85_1392600 [compost metagenome]
MRVGSAHRNADVSLTEASAERVDRAEVLRRDVGLATEVQLAPAVAGQTDGGLTTEQAAVLSRLAIARIKARFQLENSAQAVTQVFRTTQTPARTVLDAVDHAETATVQSVGTTADLVVAEARVDDAVQGDRRFCLGDTGKTGEQGGSEQSLFHLRNLR